MTMKATDVASWTRIHTNIPIQVPHCYICIDKFFSRAIIVVTYCLSSGKDWILTQKMTLTFTTWEGLLTTGPSTGFIVSHGKSGNCNTFLLILFFL